MNPKSRGVGRAALFTLVIVTVVLCARPFASPDHAAAGDLKESAVQILVRPAGDRLPGGNTVTAEVTISNVPAAGLGAWTIDLAFDPNDLELPTCTPSQVGKTTLGACNPEFSRGTIRLTGADPEGIHDGSRLATITFSCRRFPLTTTITWSASVLVDATLGDPHPLALGGSSSARIACLPPEPSPEIVLRGPTGSSTTLRGGETVTTEIIIAKPPAHGLGAWTIDLMFDPNAVTVESCIAPQVSPSTLAVCNPAFAAGVVRVSGADPNGLRHETLLAQITFRCSEQDRRTTLTWTAPVMVDATVGDPQPFNSTGSYASIICIPRGPAAPPVTPPSLPPLGMGSSDRGMKLAFSVLILVLVECSSLALTMLALMRSNRSA